MVNKNLKCWRRIVGDNRVFFYNKQEGRGITIIKEDNPINKNRKYYYELSDRHGNRIRDYYSSSKKDLTEMATKYMKTHSNCPNGKTVINKVRKTRI